MTKESLILALADKTYSDRLIKIANHLNRKMPTGMTSEGKSLSVNLLMNTYLHGYSLYNIANMLGIKPV